MDKVYEDIDIVFIFTDTQMKIIHVSYSLEKIFGYKKEEILGKSVENLMTDNDKENHKLYVEKYKQTGEGVILNKKPRLVKGLHKNGNTIILHLSISHLFLPCNEMFVASFLDLNNIKKFDEKFFVNVMTDGYFDWYMDSNYEYMSPRFWEIFGYKPEEKEHKPEEWMDIINKDDLKIALKNLDKHIKTKGKFPYFQNIKYKHKDGHDVTVLCKGKVIEWKDDKPLRMVGTHTDITELVSLQNEIYKKDKKIKENTEFLGKVCHEIRSPLHGIIGSLNLIDNETYKDIPMLKKFIEIIRKSSDRLMNIVNNMLSLIRLENEKSFIVEELNLKLLISNILDMYKSQNYNLDFFLNYNANNLVYSDSDKIEKVLYNLIHNACKFTKKGKITINVYEEENIIIKVKDTGIGIAEEHIDKIFDKFYQCNDKHTDNVGTGLGLSICKTVCDKINGNISVKSKLGVGTEFTFSFLSDKSLCKSEKKQVKILIVDDNEDNIEILKFNLLKYDFKNIYTCLSGEEAIEKCKNTEYDFVLLDVHMPGNYNGIEACEEIRKIENHQPFIIMVTAHVVKEIKNKCIRVGANCFLNKPIDYNKLNNILNEN